MEGTESVPRFPHIDLSDAERLWLSKVHEKAEKKERVEKRQIRLELADRLPPDFQPDSIDRRLLQGTEITLLGILHVDASSPITEWCHRTILAVREMMKDPSHPTRFEAVEVAGRAGLSPDQVKRAWAVLRTVGFFNDGADNDFNYIFAGDDETTRTYLSYVNMEQQLKRAFESQVPVLYRYPSSASVPIAISPPDSGRPPGSTQNQTIVIRDSKIKGSNIGQQGDGRQGQTRSTDVHVDLQVSTQPKKSFLGRILDRIFRLT